MKKIGYIIIVLSMFLSSCSEKVKVKTLRLAHGLPTSHPVHIALEKFANDVVSTSKGKLAIKIYPSEQLGGERDCIELLQIGSLDITKVSAATLGNFDRRYTVFGLPYLMQTKAHRYKFYESETAKKMLGGMEQFELKGLCFYDAGSRSFYGNKPIKSSEDLKGLKIRVMKNPKSIKMVNTLGGAATPISFGELYSALQQGVVDGAENNPSSFYTSKHYEVCKHYSLDEHTSTPDVVVMAKKTWNNLTKEEKKWITTSIKISQFHQIKLWDDFEKKFLIKLKEEGVQIHKVDKTQFRTLTREMYGKDKIGQEIHDIVEEIKLLANEK